MESESNSNQYINHLSLGAVQMPAHIVIQKKHMKQLH